MYAIQEHTTGKFLPGYQRGYSWSVPVAMTEHPPRLFLNERSARGALTQWLRGRVTAHRDMDGDVDLSIEPQPDRVRDNMRVVEVEIILV